MSSRSDDGDCGRPPAFPRLILNRPGLPRIACRIGDYGAMRAHMLALIDAAPALAAWTHRGSDDPGIALVEGTAVVGDILSLYQDDYANEAYLRTATLPDSVGALVRLLGYRPAPGLGGRARFAIAVKGDTPVTLPAGLALQAALEGAAAPATFETSAALTAVPALSAFHLYRPRRVPDIVNGVDTFTLGAADGVALKPGDRLMVGLRHGDAGQRAHDHTQQLVVDKVWEAFGLRYVKTKGGIECLSGGRLALRAASVGLAPAAGLALQALAPARSVPGLVPLRFAGPLLAGLAVPRVASTPAFVAWKLAGSHDHFGHTAPPTKVVVDAQGRATQRDVSFDRALGARQGGDCQPELLPQQLPLDGPARDVAAGVDVLVEANLSAAGGAGLRKRLLVRRVRQIDAQSMSWGAQSGAATVLTLDSDLSIAEDGLQLDHTDIRGVAVHAVDGAAFTLQAAPVATAAATGNTLDFYGGAADAQALALRTVLLLEPAGPAPALVQRVRRVLAGEPRFELTLDRTVEYRFYAHDAPAVTVHGNLVDATEGRTEPEAVLGDGDARAVFQTFALPKAPLTFLLDATAAPPQVPELEVRVDGLRWQRVDSFFDRGPLDTVYIVRQGDDGRSWVQFGDGRSGARPASGQGNIVARYRSGGGSRGPLKAGASVSAQPRVAGFDKAFMPEPATGGAAPEPAGSVRIAAPGTMQSLGRIVSLADCETEAQALPGVLKARAGWTLQDGAPVLMLTVLADGLALADAQALSAALRSAFAARGPARFALRLRLGNRRFADVALRIGHDARRRPADLLPAVQRALGTSPDDVALDDEPTGGLFDWRERQFGQDVHGSQVVGRVQNVDGVAWVELQRLGAQLPRLALAPAVSAVAQPAAQRRLRCPGESLLALRAADLQVEWVAVAVAGGRA